MSEMCEDFREMRKMSAEKRQSNLEKSTEILRENGVLFKSFNHGYQLQINTKSGIVNFYPSTGLYNGVLSGRGVFNLLKELGIEVNNEQGM